MAHQLSSLYKADGKKQFDSVIVVTDRTVLDAQLQDTIYQFEHTDGVVGRINNKEGDGSKSEKLAGALESAQPIIIVTIQTFPHVLKAIENSVSLKDRCYAIIADEAHSSQSGSTARQLKEVLMKEAGEAGDEAEELDSDDIIAATVAARRASGNLSYFAFTATPKAKTLELFGRVPRPDEVASTTNKPAAFHVYARNLRPMLRETLLDEDDIDLGNVVLSHYRVAKMRQQDLVLRENTAEYKLEPGEGLGTAKPKDKQEEFLSQIINRLNEVFVTDQLTDKDMVNYAYTIRDKVGENMLVMKQIENNSTEQALLGDFSKAIDDAILDSSEAHQNQMMQLLADPSKAANFARIVFDLLVQGQAGNR